MCNNKVFPPTFANWKSLNDKYPLRNSFEFPLFSDVKNITGGNISFGPYTILNTLSFSQDGLRPILVLRIDNYINPASQIPDPQKLPNKSNFSYFHGGNLEDEISALLSLCLGIRVKPGGCTREFFYSENSDPKGKPCYTNRIKDPLLNNNKTLHRKYTKETPLSKLNILKNIFPIDIDTSIALIRSARLYQEGLWIIESDPNLAFVMFVSAIEVAALNWDSSKLFPQDKLKSNFEDIYNILKNSLNVKDFNIVCNFFGKYCGSFDKFFNFILTFKPDPPNDRPHKNMQYDYSDDNNFRKDFRKIYEYRSNFLHSGIPFPFPMCSFLSRFNEEIPLGLDTYSNGYTFIKKDLPMLIGTFEHLVRGSLLNWINSIFKNFPKTS